MKNRTEIAISKFMEGYNCSQAVSYSFCYDHHFDKNTALKMSCGFGAGIRRKEEVCGAVTGGIIVIGNKYGRGEKDHRSATETTYKKTRDLMDYFTKKHGTFICPKLLDGCELTTEDGQKQFKEKDLLNKICKPCVQNVVEFLENTIKHA